jgi:hypothetical protein
VGERIYFGIAVVVRTILDMRNPFGMVGAGGTLSVADFSDSPAMLLPVTLALVLPSGICTVISVLVVDAAGAPLTYSVYESASNVASHAKVTVRSASAEVASAKYMNDALIIIRNPL